MYSLRHLAGAVLAVALLLSPPAAHATPCCQDSSGALYSSGELAGAFIELLFKLFVGIEPLEHSVSHSGRARSSDESSGIRLFGLDGGALIHGGESDLRGFLAIEGERLGVEGRATLLYQPGDNAAFGTDYPVLARLHLTYALVATERARMRLEAGVSSMHLADHHSVGASAGLSLEACLGGPFDWDLRAQLTPFPYWQLDVNLGLALRVNVLAVRAGIQWLQVEENGIVHTGASQASVLGPYLGAGLVF